MCITTINIKGRGEGGDGSDEGERGEESDERGGRKGSDGGEKEGKGVREREGGKAVMWEGKVVVHGHLLFMGGRSLSAMCICHSSVGGCCVHRHLSFVYGGMIVVCGWEGHRFPWALSC